MRIFISVALFFMIAVADASPLTAAQIERHLFKARADSPSYKDIPGDLTRSLSFTALWQKPEQVIPHARSMLLSPKLTVDDKLILVLALQNARWQELFGLYEWAFDCYLNEKLSSKIVEKLIFPDWDWNTRLFLRYEDSDVQKLLIRIQESKFIREQQFLGKYIPDILSGKIADGIKQARRDGDLLDRNRKD